jgi:hypothetical protein
MKIPNSPAGHRIWVTLLLAAVLAGCGGGGGGRDPILGFDGVAPGAPVVPVVPGAPGAAVPPTVTAVAPVNLATGVPLNTSLITAEFSEPMSPIAGPASFTLSCAAPCVSPAGTVTLNDDKRLATLALAPGAQLAASTTYTGRVAGARSLANDLPMTSPYTWTFTTGAVADITRPRVELTVPATTVPGPTGGVPVNTAISAVFTEPMAPATVNATSFQLACAAPCVAPAGTVTYVVGNRTAVYAPAAALVAGQTYTATITTQATDLAGNALAGNQAALPAASAYVWTFVTAATALPPGQRMSVLSTQPHRQVPANVCTDATVNATFSVPSGLRMDPCRHERRPVQRDRACTRPDAGGRIGSVVFDAAHRPHRHLHARRPPLTAGVTYTRHCIRRAAAMVCK